MGKDKKYSPIIIIGMHRSGTSMITDMLQQLGLFIGNDLEENSESLFFIGLNEWLMKQSGSTWDNPKAINWFYKNEEAVGLAEDYIKEQINGNIKFLGLKRKLLGHKTLDCMNQPWGWKDPRNTFTLTFWLRMFPDARIIHIYRNGVAVASSLRSRARKEMIGVKRNFFKRKRLGLYRLRAKKKGMVASQRAFDLFGSFSLWEEYVEKSLEMISANERQSFSIKYEDFLMHPSVIMSDLCNFCGLEPTRESINKVVSSVRVDRGDSFRHDSELLRFYNETKATKWMKYFEY